MMFVNPKARQGSQFGDEISKWLNDNQFEILNSHFDPKKEKITDVILRHRDEADVVLVGGGDGSVNEALPALIETQLPLLLIPLGTANNLARTMEIPNPALEALTLLKTGQIQEVDLGVANDIPFVNVIGLGLSTQVNRLVRSESKRLFGVFAFILMAFKVGLRMTPFRIHVDYDGTKHVAYTWQVTICNGRNYGSGLVIHEEASLKDETLHGLSTEVKKWWHSFILIPGLMRGKFESTDDVTTFKGQEITLTTRTKMHVDIDGDIKTKTPLKITVMPRALKMFAPVPTSNEKSE